MSHEITTWVVFSNIVRGIRVKERRRRIGSSFVFQRVFQETLIQLDSKALSAAKLIEVTFFAAELFRTFDILMCRVSYPETVILPTPFIVVIMLIRCLLTTIYKILDYRVQKSDQI